MRSRTRGNVRGEGFRLAAFSTIGLMNAMIDIGVLNVLLILYPATDRSVLFVYNSLAYVFAVTNSYVWNSRITFRGQADFGWREKGKFALQAGVALLVNNGVFLLGVQALEGLEGAGVLHEYGLGGASQLGGSLYEVWNKPLSSGPGAFGTRDWFYYNAAKAAAMLLSSACSFLLMKVAVFTRKDGDG